MPQTKVKQTSNPHKAHTGLGEANKCIKSIEVVEGTEMGLGLWDVWVGPEESGIGKPEIKSDKSKLDVCAPAVNTYRN